MIIYLELYPMTGHFGKLLFYVSIILSYCILEYTFEFDAQLNAKTYF